MSEQSKDASSSPVLPSSTEKQPLHTIPSLPELKFAEVSSSPDPYDLVLTDEVFTKCIREGNHSAALERAQTLIGFNVDLSELIAELTGVSLSGDLSSAENILVRFLEGK